MRRSHHPDGPRLLDAYPEVVRMFSQLANAGPMTVQDLLLLGILTMEDLAKADPDAMYREICRIEGVEHDIRVRDVYASLVDQARGNPARPWFEYSRERRRRAREEEA